MRNRILAYYAVIIVNLELISHIVLVFPLLVLNKPTMARTTAMMSISVFIINFGQILHIDQVFSLLT